MKLDFGIKGLKWEFGKEGEVRTGIPIPKPTRAERAHPSFRQPTGQFHSIAWINATNDGPDGKTMTLGIYFIDDAGNNSHDRTRQPDRRLLKAFDLRRSIVSCFEYLEYDIPLNSQEAFPHEAIMAAQTAMRALGVKRDLLRHALTYFTIAYECTAERNGKRVPYQDALRKKFRLKIPEPFFPLL